MELTKEQLARIDELKSEMRDLGVNVDGKEPEAPSGKESPSDEYMKVVNECTTALRESVDAQKNIATMLEAMKKAGSGNRQIMAGEKFRTPLAVKGAGLQDVLVMAKKEGDLEDEIARLNDDCVSIALHRAGRAANKASIDTLATTHLQIMESSDAFKQLNSLRQKADEFWHTGTALAGANWVPTGYASSYIDVYRLARNIPAIFQNTPMPNRSGTFRIPVKSSRAAWAIAAESDGSSFTFPYGSGVPSKAATNLLALTAVKHKGISGVSREEEEDAILIVMNVAREELALSAMDCLETALLNGQASGDASLDGANGPAAANGYMPSAKYGLRGYSVVTATNTVNAAGDALTLADFEAARVAQIPFSVRPRENVFITTPRGYLDLMTEASSPVKTVDAYGSGATILSGELGSIEGYPIVVTEETPDLSALGKADGIGGFGASILCNYGRWRRGTKRGIEIREIEIVGDDAMVLVGFMRTAFASALPATDDHTVVIRNHL